MGDAWVSLPSRPVGCLRPFGLGIPARGGPIPAVTTELSLLPTSRSPCTIALLYRRATAEAERKGLPQLTTEKLQIGEVGAYTPVGVLDVALLFGRRGDQPTYHLVTACQPLLPFPIHEVLNGSLLTLNRPILP